MKVDRYVRFFPGVIYSLNGVVKNFRTVAAKTLYSLKFNRSI